MGCGSTKATEAETDNQIPKDPEPEIELPAEASEAIVEIDGVRRNTIGRQEDETDNILDELITKTTPEAAPNPPAPPSIADQKKEPAPGPSTPDEAKSVSDIKFEPVGQAEFSITDLDSAAVSRQTTKKQTEYQYDKDMNVDDLLKELDD